MTHNARDNAKGRHAMGRSLHEIVPPDRNSDRGKCVIILAIELQPSQTICAIFVPMSRQQRNQAS
jgi:hypothetical protein